MHTKPVQIKLNVPQSMRQRIKELAEQNCRSMNSEIVFRLERAIFDPLEARPIGDVHQIAVE